MNRPNLRRLKACAGLGIAVLLSGILASTRGAGAEGWPNRELRNDYLAVLISDRGELQRVENLESSETYEVEADSFTIVTDWGSLSNRTTLPTSHEVVPDHARYTFSNGKLFEVVLEYTLAPGHRYLRRRLTVDKIDVPLALLKVEFGRTAFQTVPQEIIKYDTFWNAPTVDFLRWEKGGLFTGIENPFFETDSTGREITLSFEPSLILRPGETYESEPQFVGIYSKSGYMIRDHAPKTRLAKDGVYRPRFRNPSGHIPLDRNEIRAMSEFAAEYLQVSADRFLFILYCYWNPMPQLPSTEADEKEYCRMIDNFQELGGDLIIFNPLVKAQIPTEDPESFWELAPRDSPAERILAYAGKKGIKYGFYMGVAAQMEHGNAAALPFAPSRSDWKKVDSAGNVARENCLGSDSYADWWFKVQRNTIAKYKLSLWSWDPGPGNAFFCYSNQHGHIPGKGGYKGWRNTTAIMRRLKEEFPGLYYQGFYGRKEYGLWGLKYIDQHEAYWEQQAQYLASIHPDIHSDRMNADGVRLQSWWNQTFRFLPAVMNHALVHRLTQVYADDPKLKRVWDHTGWKYAFMSGLAIGGSITAPILPETLDDVTGYKAFYEKWLRWARKNFEYVKYNVPFGEQVQAGGIDGYARIKGDHGYIFLCNPGPRPARTQFNLDDTVGLKAKGRFTLKELYPNEDAYYFDETNRRGIYAAGNAVSILVPAYQVVLLELSPFKEDQLPLLFGARGQLKRAGSTLRISGVEGEQGKTARLVVATREKENPRAFTVNSLAVRVQHEGQYSSADVRFAGTDLVRTLDDWRTADGNQFSFPIHDAYDDLSLTTMFRADPQIRALLRAAQPTNLAEIQPLINNWLKNGFPDTFTWARPDRLILVVPFADADRVRKVALQLNGAEKDLRCYELAGGFSGQANKIIFYADLTDAIRWAQENTLTLHVDRMAANQFLGPYLDYPPAPTTSQVRAAGPAVAQAVVYVRPVQPELSPKRAKEPGIRIPRIVSAWMNPDSIREQDDVTFYVTANLPPDELQGVYLSSVVGPDCSANQELQYNPETKTWLITLKLRERVRMILDCPYSYVWAVAKDGQVSDTWKIPMGWLFSK